MFCCEASSFFAYTILFWLLPRTIFFVLFPAGWHHYSELFEQNWWKVKFLDSVFFFLCRKKTPRKLRKLIRKEKHALWYLPTYPSYSIQRNPRMKHGSFIWCGSHFSRHNWVMEHFTSRERLLWLYLESYAIRWAWKLFSWLSTSSA